MSKLWGSRFKKRSDALADQFSFSISYDHRLAKYDVIGSMAHAQMLGKCKIISRKDAQLIVSGLKKIAVEIDKGRFKIDPKAEDIHTQIQTALKKNIGPSADKLHTARSRNDQIVLDMKLYCLVEYSKINDLICTLQKTLVKCAAKNMKVIIPAYTHLQSAQVVLLAHHLLAYVEMLDRDRDRILGTIKRTNTMPLGSCALSGTSLLTNRNYITKHLGLAQTTSNSIDSVSDRDFIIEGLADLSILAMHFSRIAEDLILWASQEFNYISIDGSLCTGSSIMPHKKNPDILELIRGETSGVYSNLQEVLVLMKGLPLTYNRDLQLDKPPLFQSVDKIQLMLQLFVKTFDTIKINKSVLAQRTQDESFFTVDIMEYLIKKGVTYRDAHDIVGKLVKNCLDHDVKLSTLPIKKLKSYSPHFKEDVKKLLNPQMSVKIKKSFGSTNPALVQTQINYWKKKLNA